MDSPMAGSMYSFINAPFSPAPAFLSETLSPPELDLDFSDQSLRLPFPELSALAPQTLVGNSPSPSGSTDPNLLFPEVKHAEEDDATIEEPGEIKARKRGRKARNVTEEQKREAHEKRVERNRYFARENRMKKKQYIVELENRVAGLETELAMCKQRLAEYESAGGSNNAVCVNFEQLSRRLKMDTHGFAEQRLRQLATIIHGAEKNFLDVVPTLKSSVLEKDKMIDAISELMLDFSVPAPTRCMFRFAGEDCFVSSSVPKRIVEESNIVSKEVRKQWEQLMAVAPETKKLFQRVASNIRDDLCKYFNSLESIKRHMNELDCYMIERVMPRLQMDYIDNVVRWLHETIKQKQARICCGEDSVHALALVKLSPKSLAV